MIANPHRGEVGIPGTEYVLRFSTNDFASAETETGENIMAVLGSLGDTPPARHLRLLFWCGLRHQDPAITIERAGEIMDEVGLSAVATAIGAAIKAAFPEVDPSQKKALRSTG
jgi:hypothetical protein